MPHNNEKIGYGSAQQGVCPRLSVITVVLNDLNGLRRTYESLLHIDVDFEWLVIDGKSSDGAQDWFLDNQKHGMRIVSEPDRGIYDAMNKGWSLARGDWVYFLNSGDVLCRGLADFLTQDSAIDIVSGRVELVDASGQLVGQTHPVVGARRDDLRAANCIAHQATLLRRNLIERYGAYSLDYRIQGDFEYWVRLQAAGVCFKFVDDVIARFDYVGVSSQRRNYLHAEAERRSVLRQYGFLSFRQAALAGLRAFVLFHLKTATLAVLPAELVSKLRLNLNRRKKS